MEGTDINTEQPRNGNESSQHCATHPDRNPLLLCTSVLISVPSVASVASGLEGR